MKKNIKYALAALALSMSGNVNAQYQLENSDFEDWEAVKYKKSIKETVNGEEPKSWSSFIDGNVAGTLFKSAVGEQLFKSTVTRPNSAGKYSAKLESRKVLGIATAQGNLTNGCINMGSMTPEDATGNFNFINESRLDQSMKFSGHPDALKVWVKYSGKSTGNVEVLLTTKGYYQSPYANKSKITAKLVANAQNSEIPSSSNWVEYTIPFNYQSSDVPYYALVNISTCAVPGEGDISDEMYVDDLVMVYNSELASVSYDGVEVSVAPEMSIDAEYDENLIQLTSNGRAASIETNYNEETGVLTVNVTAEDGSECHTYSIQFAKPALDIPVIASTDYTDDLYVTVNGMNNPAQEDVTVKMETLENGNINFVLKDFLLITPDDLMPVGNIEIKNLELSDVENGKTFTFSGMQTIKPGSDIIVYEGEEFEMAEDDWAGPELGAMNMELSGMLCGNNLYVEINIALAGQDVTVQLGYKPTTVNVDFTNADYATLVIPTAAEIPAGVKAFAIAGVDASNTLVLEEVATIEANMPVLLQKDGASSASFVTTVKTYETSTCGLLTGVYEETAAPQGSYVLQKQGEKVAFFKVASDDIMIGANRAYLTVPSNAKVLNFATAATAINAVNALVGGKAEVYGANGARQNGLQKGMNIIKMTDGSVQKVLVK